MIPRQLEPEVMDTREEAIDYNSMDHSEVNRMFAEDVLELVTARKGAGNQRSVSLLDLGTGTALIPIEVCQRNNCVRVVATDLAVEMLKIAERNLLQAGLEHVISLERADAKQLPCSDQSFEGVISNSLIHHIPEPGSVIREIVRVVKSGGFIFLRDLLRPESQVELERLVKQYAGQANPRQRQLFHDSLHAALTLDEVRALLEQCGLPPDAVQKTSDRHWTVSLILPYTL
ncbi:MAG: class I SAM-dependent methyltransferase [Planctomycetota bacterium]